MRRLLPAVLIFLLIGPLPVAHYRFPTDDLTQEVTARRLHIPVGGDDGTLRLVGGWHLASPHTYFGGFSALARIGPGHFRLVGDNGWSTTVRLAASGSVSEVRIAPLPVPEGQPRRKTMVDAEAMVLDPSSGESWLALEGINEVWRLDATFTRVESRGKLPATPRWPANRGPEAMVRLADGRTIIFSEDADADPRGREALVYADDPAVPGKPPIRFFYDSRGKGLVSDAATLPDGRILLIHRRLGFRPVFTTYVGIVDPADIAEDAVVRSRTIGRVPVALAENYEAATVAVEGGRTFLWLASDDNLNRWQRSLLLQFELVDLPPRKTDSKKAARVEPAA